MESRHVNTAEAEGHTAETRQAREAEDPSRAEAERAPCCQHLAAALHMLPLAVLSCRRLASGENTRWTFAKTGNETLTCFEAIKPAVRSLFLGSEMN